MKPNKIAPDNCNEPHSSREPAVTVKPPDKRQNKIFLTLRQITKLIFEHLRPNSNNLKTLKLEYKENPVKGSGPG